jgi:transcriptional regulator with XRE-family HTH domain
MSMKKIAIADQDEWDAIILRLGNTVRMLREKEHLSLRELSEKISIGHSDLFRIENGSTRNPSIQLIRKVAQHFDLTTDELMNFDAKTCPMCGGRGWVK